MAIQIDSTPNKLFSQAQHLFKQGNLSQSKRIYQNLLSLHATQDNSLIPTLHYNCLLNLSTILLQQNNLQQAKQLLKKAIISDSQRYEAFYNLVIANFYSNSSPKQSLQCLKHCLSILYLQLGILTNSLKLLNKSISLNNKNAKSYIHRALFYENNQKNKLASNQFQKLTFEHDEYQFSHKMLAEIYARKALFFRRIKNTDKMEESLILYRKHKQQAQYQKNKTPQQILNLLNNTFKEVNQGPTQQDEDRQTIISMVKQVQQLIKQINEQKSKQNQSPLLQNKIPSNQSPNISPQKVPNNISHQSVSHQEPKQQENLLQSQVPQQSTSLPHHDQNPSISINEDEDSAILNQKIQELQRQIKQSGGNVPEVKDMSRNSEEQNFLEFQITKTIEEINQKKQQGDSKIKKTTESLHSEEKSVTSSGEPNSTHGDNKDNLTLRSKISQTYELNLEQIKVYKSFELEIRSVTMFDQKCPRKDAYVIIRYLSHELLTEKCKNDKFTWNHNFDQMPMKHDSLEDDDQDETKYEMHIQVHAKEGGWLSWHNDVLLGTGIIKLTEKGATKCTLQNKGKKVGMLYYKAKLHKFEEEHK